MHPPLTLNWSEDGQPRSALWQADTGARLPSRVQAVSALDANSAYRLASAGTGLLWRGDFQAARQLLQGMSQRLEAATQRQQQKSPANGPAERFAQHRQTQALRVRVLGQLLIELDGAYRIALPRAPEVVQACTEAWGPADGQARVLSLRSLQGLIGAHEWRKKGVPVAALQGAHIHPHHGVFSPVRGEYIALVAQAPLPAALAHCPRAFDIGVGTGVLSAVLARRGIAQVVATDVSPRALACAADNLQRLGLTAQVQLQRTDLFPEGQAALVVCNPPWLPGRPNSVLEQAVYDEDSGMLRGFPRQPGRAPGGRRRRLADLVGPGRTPGSAHARTAAGLGGPGRPGGAWPPRHPARAPQGAGRKRPAACGARGRSHLAVAPGSGLSRA